MIIARMQDAHLISIHDSNNFKNKKKDAESGNTEAMYQLGLCYQNDSCGFSQDYDLSHLSTYI